MKVGNHLVESNLLLMFGFSTFPTGRLDLPKSLVLLFSEHSICKWQTAIRASFIACSTGT